jgi:hypothetical protein
MFTRLEHKTNKNMSKIILIALISYSQAVKIHSFSQLGVKFDLDGALAAAEETVN